MLTYLQAILLGALQGISELFPVSSLGHSVLVPSLLHWNLTQSNEVFVVFLVATHFATALVLFIFYRKDWMRIFAGMWRSLKAREISATDRDAKLGWMLVLGTVPAGILGLLFEDALKQTLAVPLIVSVALALNGLMLLGAEALRKKQQQNGGTMATLGWKQSFLVGCAQCLALIPGFSRTGATITGGLLTGLSHEEAAHFSFLLATPIIGAAAVLKLPELAGEIQPGAVGPILCGCIAAALAAYIAVRFLTKYFETKKLTPFAIYCLVIGLACSAIFWR
jgi:undecaprenyl-diphosphatase